METPSPFAIQHPGAELRLPRLSAVAWLALVSLPILVFLLTPLLIIVPMALTKTELLVFPPEWASLKHFRGLASDPQWTSATLLSIKVALLATAVACVVGASTALALHRSALPHKALITAMVLLPAMVPVVVLALGDYLFFSRLGLTGSWVCIGLAHAVMVTPFTFVAIQASLAALDPALPRAARSLGAGNGQVFTAVYWPAIRPGVLSGAVLAFIGSFDEVVVSLFLSGPGLRTLPVQMFTSLQYELSPKIAAVSSLLFGLSILALVAQAAARKKAAYRKPA